MTSPTLRFRMIWTVCHCLLSSLSPRFMYSSRGALGWGPRVITSLTYPSTNIKAITSGIPLLAPGRLKRTRTVNSYWYSGTSTLCYNSKKDVLVCRVNEAKPILKLWSQYKRHMHLLCAIVNPIQIQVHLFSNTLIYQTFRGWRTFQDVKFQPLRSPTEF